MSESPAPPVEELGLILELHQRWTAPDPVVHRREHFKEVVLTHLKTDSRAADSPEGHAKVNRFYNLAACAGQETYTNQILEKVVRILQNDHSETSLCQTARLCRLFVEAHARYPSMIRLDLIVCFGEELLKYANGENMNILKNIVKDMMNTAIESVRPSVSSILTNTDYDLTDYLGQ